MYGNKSYSATLDYVDGATANTTHTFPATGGTILNSGTSSVSKSGETLTVKINGTEKSLTNTTYSNFVKSGSGAAAGLVPAPSTTAGTTKYLREDGTWQTPPDNNTWNAASSSQAGYVPAATKGKFLHSNASTGNLEWVDDNNTTYSSKSAASGGNDVSLCTTGEKYTWNNKQAALVSGTNIKTINGKSILGSGNISVVEDLYETVHVTLSQNGGSDSDLTGQSVTITNTTKSTTVYNGTWSGSTIAVTIPVGDSYTITVGSLSGYTVKTTRTSKANSFLKEIDFRYTAFGVYVEAIDGSLYTSSQWSSAGKSANAVVVISDSLKYRMHLDNADKQVHSTYNAALENYLT